MAPCDAVSLVPVVGEGDGIPRHKRCSVSNSMSGVARFGGIGIAELLAVDLVRSQRIVRAG